MNPSRKVKFVEVDTSRGGLPVKRKQVQHACAACRRKKRRCIHTEDSTDDATGDAATTSHSAGFQTSPGTISTTSARDGTSLYSAGENGIGNTGVHFNAEAFTPVMPRAIQFASSNSNPTPSLRSSRFVSDLNPEGMLSEATGAASTREQAQKGDVGIWLSTAASVLASGHQSQFITSRPPPIMDQFLLPFVKEHCLTCLPSDEDFTHLKNTFVQKVHPMFPIIPLAALDGDLSDPITIVLRQLVSLAAGTDPDSSQHLRLGNRGPDLLTPQDFSQSLSSSVRAILETSIIADRVLHIRALTMLSLFTQPTCAEESDLPAQLGGRAIQHIQTLGLHLLRYESPNSDELETLFCAVWAIDRINGALYGRPFLLHERDIGTNLQGCIRKCPPCFRLFLLVVEWLDQVVELYRPGPTAEASGLEKIAYMDLPVFEAMIVDAEALKVQSSLIATIETFYHAVIILSCRLPRPGTQSAATTLPPPSANARRSLAADRIACAVPRDCLSFMPFVPYAVSLALSVEYRKMRHSRLPMFRARAMTAFKLNCEMLRNFGDYFWSANVVAELGERVMKEMERAANNITTRETTPQPADGGQRQAESRKQGDNLWGTRDTNTIDPMAINVAEGMDNAVDFSAVDAISGQDVFGHIDPNFNLTAVEDALEANLDIGLPLNWGDWGQFTA